MWDAKVQGLREYMAFFHLQFLKVVLVSGLHTMDRR